MIANKPASPLPPLSQLVADAESEAGRKYRAEQERRAKAYPKLVDALREASKWLEQDAPKQALNGLQRTLRELGEL
jgi:hypothetical protein